MNYARLDEAIIRQYQKLVDVLGVSRVKLIETCAAGYSVFRIPAVLLSEVHPAIAALSILFSILVSGFCILDSKRLMPLLDVYRNLRLFFLVIVFISVFFLLVNGYAPYRVMYLVGDILIYSAYVFLVCKDPPPPRKKTSTKPIWT